MTVQQSWVCTPDLSSAPLTHCEFSGISSGRVEISWRRGGLACEVAAGLDPQSKAAPWEWISAAANSCALVQGRDQFLQQYFGRICLSRARVLLRADETEILELLSILKCFCLFPRVEMLPRKCRSVMTGPAMRTRLSVESSVCTGSSLWAPPWAAASMSLPLSSHTLGSTEDDHADV